MLPGHHHHRYYDGTFRLLPTHKCTHAGQRQHRQFPKKFITFFCCYHRTRGNICFFFAKRANPTRVHDMRGRSATATATAATVAIACSMNGENIILLTLWGWWLLYCHEIAWRRRSSHIECRAQYGPLYSARSKRHKYNNHMRRII